MMIEVEKQIAQLQTALDAAIKSGDSKEIEKLEFAIEKIKEIWNFGNIQNRER